MSGVTQLLSYVGPAIGGIFKLGSSLVDGIVGPDGVFAKTLDAVSGANPYQAPNLPPGERASVLEQHVIQLEQLLADREALLAQQSGMLEITAQMGDVAKVLDKANLTKDERDAVFAKVLAFLSNRNVAEKLGTPAPDQTELHKELDEMLKLAGILDQERTDILQQVDDTLSGVAKKDAA